MLRSPRHNGMGPAAVTRADDLRAQLNDLQAQKKVLVVQLARLDTRPTEPEDGTVIRFNITYSGNSTAYRYAALRVDGFWYSTGRADHKRVTWDALLDWMQERGTKCYAVLGTTAWVRLP